MLLENFTFHELDYCKKNLKSKQRERYYEDPLKITEILECVIDEIDKSIEDDLFFESLQSKHISEYFFSQSSDNLEISKRKFQTFLNFIDDLWCSSCDQEKIVLWIDDDNCSSSWFTCLDLCEEEQMLPYQLCYNFFNCHSKSCYYHAFNGWEKCTNVQCDKNKEKHEENCIEHSTVSWWTEDEIARYVTNKEQRKQEREQEAAKRMEITRIRLIAEKANQERRKIEEEFSKNLLHSKENEKTESLKNLCRLKIHEQVKYWNINKLLLPESLKLFLRFDLPHLDYKRKRNKKGMGNGKQKQNKKIKN